MPSEYVASAVATQEATAEDSNASHGKTAEKTAVAIRKPGKRANGYRSRQGEAWDQIALARLSGERQMGDVLALNVDELDALLLSGETHISVPEQAAAERVRSLPPWERM